MGTHQGVPEFKRYVYIRFLTTVASWREEKQYVFPAKPGAAIVPGCRLNLGQFTTIKPISATGDAPVQFNSLGFNRLEYSVPFRAVAARGFRTAKLITNFEGFK